MSPHEPTDAANNTPPAPQKIYPVWPWIAGGLILGTVTAAAALIWFMNNN